MSWNFILHILCSLCCTTFSPQVFSAAEEGHPKRFSQMFYYDDPMNAKGLHLSADHFFHTGHWHVESIKEPHIPFYQKMFSHKDVMQVYDDGRSFGADAASLYTMHREHFAMGNPYGFMTVLEPEIGHPFKFINIEPTKRAGCAEISYALDPHYHGRRYGTNIINWFVHQWAPEVRRIGLGEKLDPITDAKKIEAFKCFEGAPLGLLEARVSAPNVPSWKILDRAGFEAALYGVADEDLEPKLYVEMCRWELCDFTIYIDMERELVKLYDAREASPLLCGRRYRMTDVYGTLRTFSKQEGSPRIKFHFEKEII